MATPQEILEFAYFNKHGRMPGESKPATPKKYALFAGTQKIMEGEYALLVWKKNQMTSQGHRFLKIKPI